MKMMVAGNFVLISIVVCIHAHFVFDILVMTLNKLHNKRTKAKRTVYKLQCKLRRKTAQNTHHVFVHFTFTKMSMYTSN